MTHLYTHGSCWGFSCDHSGSPSRSTTGLLSILKLCHTSDTCAYHYHPRHDAPEPDWACSAKRFHQDTTIPNTINTHGTRTCAITSPSHRWFVFPHDDLTSLTFWLDSWVEITSQPSSSSLSSAGDQDEVLAEIQLRSRRRPIQALRLPEISQHRDRGHQGPSSAGGSSQDEYEESESDSEKNVNRSNEDLARLEQDDDETSTALGRRDTAHAVFTPQPNVFSHPTPSRSLDRPTGSYFPAITSQPDSRAIDGVRPNRPSIARHSLPTSFSNNRIPNVNPQRRAHVGRQDHDEALRASLTTLLSCAAAVRSTPKTTQPEAAGSRQHHGTAEPTTFRVLSEAQLPGGQSSRRTADRRSSPTKTTTPPTDAAMIKRKARDSSKDRLTKKARNAAKSTPSDDDSVLSTTLVSWAISAGIVLVFSAVSFSAGYAWGKEAGRLEADFGTVRGSSCGQEMMKTGGLRRLKWTTNASSIST